MTERESRPGGTGGQDPPRLGPLVTVIVPTRHRNDLLDKCISALAPGAQTLDAGLYEVVVTDDGSASTAEAMLRERHPWVRWVPGPRRGPGANRNSGARHARGEWLAFTDDDCLPERRWLEAFVSALRPGTELYEGRTTCQAGIRRPLDHSPVNETGGYLWSCNMLVGRACYEKLGGFDEAFPHAHMEDVDFRERALGAGYEFPFVRDAVVDHPPRTFVTGLRHGAAQESEFLFWFKSGNTGTFLLRQVRRLAAGRIKSLLRTRFSPQTLTAFAHLFPEVAYLFVKGPGWERKYRELYREGRPPFLPDVSRRVGHRR